MKCEEKINNEQFLHLHSLTSRMFCLLLFSTTFDFKTFRFLIFKLENNNNLMCKRNFITLKKNKRLYKLCSDDIKEVYKFIKRKTPLLPHFESPTSEETFQPENIETVHSWHYDFYFQLFTTWTHKIKTHRNIELSLVPTCPETKKKHFLRVLWPKSPNPLPLVPLKV